MYPARQPIAIFPQYTFILFVVSIFPTANNHVGFISSLHSQAIQYLFLKFFAGDKRALAQRADTVEHVLDVKLTRVLDASHHITEIIRQTLPPCMSQS